MTLGRKKRAKRNAAKRVVATDTPVYDRLVDDLKFAPHQSPPGDWRNIPGAAGLLEDNFS